MTVIAIVGLGYVGLPLAMAYADAGANVIGIDIDEKRVESLRAHKSYVGDVSDADLVRNDARFFPTTGYEYINQAYAIFVCVPTPYDAQKHPDLTAIESAAASIGDNLGESQVIILESTSWPGTTVDVFAKTLFKSASFWHAIIEEPIIAFASERVNPGSGVKITDITKVVGVHGGRHEEEQRVCDVLKFAGFKPHLVSSPAAAEMSKLLENTFRAVNIALANEMAILCDRMRLDVWEVIEAAKTKPYGFMAFYPSAGVGGHCIPIDPYYLHAKAMEYDLHMRSIETAMAINEGMPKYVADLAIKTAAEYGCCVRPHNTLILGKSYKPGTDDTRGAPSQIISSLLGGAPICDSPTYDQLRRADIMIITVNDPEYDYSDVLDRAIVVIDCCNATAEYHQPGKNVRYLGCDPLVRMSWEL